MKLFKQLLVAPAALGLLAPVATQAAELNMDAIKKYSSLSSKEQVTSISQFSDVQPTDWAYQALSNLIERYGCVAGYPNGTYQGGKAMSRFEAAALLNACLDRVSEVTDELKRLMAEFEKELAVLKGRVDGLEAKVGVLEAQQFSTTTKLQGDMTFVIGGLGYGGSSTTTPNAPANTFRNRNPQTGALQNTAANNGISFNYDMRLNLSTSWTGKDLMYTRLRSGNFGNTPFNGGAIPTARLDKASQGPGGAGAATVFVDRLWYRFPVGKELTFTVGPIARNTEILAFRPQAYNADILDFFTLSGAPGAYNKATGAAAGVVWKQNVAKGKPYLTASATYVAQNGANGDPNMGGLFSAYGANNFNFQIGGRGKNWGVAANYRYGTCGTSLRDGTPIAVANLACNNATGAAGNNGSTNSLGLGAYWQPLKSGLIPSISVGWGYTGYSQSAAIPAVANQASNSYLNAAAAQSWSAMFQWSDVFAKGNAAGFAFGQPTMITATRNGMGMNEGNYAFEWWYRFRVSNNISITPAIFYLSNTLGQSTQANGVTGGVTNGNTLNNLGVIVQTNFRF